MSGVSKCLGSRLARAISHRHTPCNEPNINFRSNLFDVCTHAKTWCYKTCGSPSQWPVRQWDIGQDLAVWAIRSHQLEENFSISPKNRYQLNLVPNRAFVSANQWADNICNAILRFQRNAFYSKSPQAIRRWIMPAVYLGLTGPNFAITLNGKCLDRSITDAVDNVCYLEFTRRLALRPTQGVLIRLKEFLYIKPEMIGRQSYLRRFIEGKTKTHTRAMYTDANYRIAVIYQYAVREKWEINSAIHKAALKEATKSYKYLRCPCCVELVGGYSSTQGPVTGSHSFTSHAEKSSGLYGNSRHYQFYCMNDKVQSVREHIPIPVQGYHVL